MRPGTRRAPRPDGPRAGPRAGPRDRREVGLRRSRRWVAGSLALAVVLTGCQALGPGLPVCGELGISESEGGAHLTITDRSGETLALRTSHLIQTQAVPSATRGLCVDELPRGWNVDLGEPRSGEVALTFAAQSLGGRFLDVRLVSSCAPAADARRSSSGDPGVQRWVHVQEEERRIPLTIVPVAERHRQEAWDTAVSLIGRQLRGSALRVEVSGSERGSVGVRIEQALNRGNAVLVIDDAAGPRDQMELRLPGLNRPIMGPLGELLAELGDRARPPHYVATWWDLSPGGCAIYEFDASGSEVATLEVDTVRAVGDFPLDAMREGLIELGYDLDGL